MYISSTRKKQTTMHSGKQTKPLLLFNEFSDVTPAGDVSAVRQESAESDSVTATRYLVLPLELISINPPPRRGGSRDFGLRMT